MDHQLRRRLINAFFMILVAAAAVCLVILFFFRNELIGNVFFRAVSILEPFIYGAVIAYLLHPVCMKIEKWLTSLWNKPGRKTHRGLIRTISMVCSILLMLLLITVLLLLVLPELVSSIARIIRAMPGAIEDFQNWIKTLDHGSTSHEIVENVQAAVATVTDYLENYLQKEVLPNLQTMVSGVTSSFMGIVDVLKNFGLGCIICAYILGGWERFTAQARLVVYAVFPERIADWIRKEVHYTDSMFSGFIHGKVLDSLIIGLICFVFVSVTRMPYALLISVLVGVTNIIPFFGPYLGAIPSMLLILTVSPVKTLVFLVFIILLQQFDGNILGPRILGDRLGISGIWILFSILVFSSLWGLVGMLVGVPVFAVIYDLLRRLILRCLARRGRNDLSEEYAQQFGEKE